MNDKIEAPALPSETWRGVLLEDDDRILVCVADGRPKFYYPGRSAPGWRDPDPDFGYRILAAWAIANADESIAVMAERKRWHHYVTAHNHARNEAEMYGDDQGARVAAQQATEAWEALGICEVHTADGVCLESRPCPIHDRQSADGGKVCRT